MLTFHRVFTYFIFCIALLSALPASAQKHRTHTVQEGETIYSLSKQYDITKEDLIKLNPDIEGSLQVGQLLILPVKEELKESAFEKHVVQPKETMYGLSKQYNISIEDLIEYNPALMHGLKIGMEIMVPKNRTEPKEDDKPTWQVKPGAAEQGFQYVTVKAKETVYSLCKKYHITEEQFYLYNPSVKESGLKEGQLVKVPLIIIPQTVEVKDSVPQEVIPKDEEEKKKFELYQVQAGETLYSISKRFKVSEKEILKLNPELKDGVQEGKYIIVPVLVKKPLSSAIYKDWRAVSKEKGVKVALALPFYLSINDSIEMKSALKGNAEVYGKSKVSLEFYNGFKLALDTLYKLGFDVELLAMDTDNDPQQIPTLLKKIRKHESDFVVGPLYASNVQILADSLPDIPVISPLSKRVETKGRRNLVNCHTPEKYESEQVLKALNKYFLDQHIVFVNPDNSETKKRVKLIRDRMMSVDTPSIDELWMVGDEYPEFEDYEMRKSNTKKTVWVINNNDPVFINDFLTKVYKLNDSTMYILGNSKVFSIPTIESRYLSELNFVGGKRMYVNHKDSATVMFINRYVNATNTYPSTYAFKGYDVGLYFTLMALANKGIDLSNKWPVFEGVIEGFDFTKPIGAGPENSFLHLLRVYDYELLKVD